MIPTLEQLIDDARRNVSHSTPEWLAKYLPYLLRAVAAEHPEVADLLNKPALYGSLARRGDLLIEHGGDRALLGPLEDAMEVDPTTHKESP